MRIKARRVLLIDVRVVVRKRIVIGLLAIVVIGVVAFFVSQPKRRTVEWHKREYLAARNGNVVADRLRRTWSRITGLEWGAPDYRQRARRMETHQRALVKLGYLGERILVVSNRYSSDVVSDVWLNASKLGIRVDMEFVFLNMRLAPNLVQVIAIKEDVPKWEELIRKADAESAGQ